MRSRPRVDPAAFDFGAANEGLGQLVRDFGEIDWFVPASRARGEQAVDAFLELQRRAARVTPELFPTAMTPTIERAGWERFLELAARTKVLRGWDWRFGALKVLGQRHAERCQWSRTDIASKMPDLQSGESLHSGALYFRLGSAVITNTPFDAPPLKTLANRVHEEAAHWYWSPTVIDLSLALEWQLAEDSSDLDDNPFAALLACYRAGYLPFSFGPEEVTLFAFDGIAASAGAPMTF